MPFSNLNLEKIGLGGKQLVRIMNPGTVTVQGISRNASCQPRFPVIANVAVRNEFSRTSKPPEEWFSAGNPKLMNGEFTGGIEFSRESPAHGR
jgi:hypothetical protein